MTLFDEQKKANVEMRHKQRVAVPPQTQAVPLPLEAQGQIGKQLREVYGQLLSEPLPEKFVKLIEALAKPESER